MAGVTDTLELDVSQALRAVDTIGKQLTATTREFGRDFTREMRQLPKLTLELNTGLLTSDVRQALRNATAQPLNISTGPLGHITLELEAAMRKVQTPPNFPDIDGPRITAEVERALRSVDSKALDLNINAAELARELNAKGVQITLDVDQAQLIRQIEQAIARADKSIVVNADAGSITATINAAIARANNNLTVNANANLSGLSEANSGMTLLGGNLKQVGGLLTTYFGIEGVGRIVDASRDLQEATTKSEAVFRSFHEEVVEFARAAPRTIGQSTQTALEATATFGNFFTSSGLALDQAVEMSKELTKLASDLASFNNIDVDDALTKLRAGLAGEIEPLRRIGISITQAEADAKALELGLVSLGEEVDFQARLQARYALILEKSGNAQDDFARTSDNLANQQRILRAQFQDLLAVVGAPLVSPLLALLQSAVPLAGIAAEQFARIVGAILPALNNLVTAAGPGVQAVFTTLADVLLELGPGLNELALGVGTLVTELGPLVAVVGVGLGEAAQGVGLVAEGIGAFLQVLTMLNDRLNGVPGILAAIVAGLGAVYVATVLVASTPLGAFVAILGAAAVALGLLDRRSGDAATRQQALAAAAQTTQQALFGQISTLRDVETQWNVLDDAMVQFVNQSSVIAQRGLSQDLLELGISAGDVAELMTEGADGVNEFAAALIDAGGIELSIDGVVQTEEQVRDLDSAVTSLLASGQATVEGNADLLAAFQDQVLALQTAERQTFENLLATGQLNQAQADAILKLPEVVAANDRYAAALDVVAGGLQKVNLELIAGLVPLAQQPQSWIALADAVARGTIGSAEYATVAQTLGTDLETVAGFADQVTEAVNRQVDAFVQGLPTAASAFDGWERDMDPNQIIDSMNLATASVDRFLENLALIRAFSPETASFLGQIGEEVAGPLAEGVRDGTVPLQELEAAIRANKEALGEAEDFFRESTLADSAGFLGAAAARELGVNLDFGGVTQEQIDNATDVLLGATLPERAEKLGVDIADGLAAGMGTFDASELMDRIEAEMREAADANSPAKRFIPLGGDIVAGVQQGLQADLSRLGRTLVPDVSAAFAGLAGGAGTAPTGTGGTVINVQVPVTVRGAASVADAQQQGKAAGEAAAGELADVLAEVLAL